MIPQIVIDTYNYAMVQIPIHRVTYAFLLAMFIVFIIQNIVLATKESFEGSVPFDYGIRQRRDVMRTDTGSDERSLAEKINDYITNHKVSPVPTQESKEGLVANASSAPAFWDNGMYNIEGKMVGGSVESTRAGEAFKSTRYGKLENFDDEKLLERYDDRKLLEQ